MQKTDKQVSLVDYVKTAAHHGKKPAKKNDELLDDTIDCEVPGDSYYTQFADDEQEVENTTSHPAT